MLKTTLPHTSYTLFRYFCDTLNLIHSLYMFRLFLIISVFMISSCSNTQPPKKKTINSLSLHEQQNMEKKSMILIMDFGDSESQIIKCCDSLLTYGVGYVETANKTISEGDVAWNSAYPIIRKRLGAAQQKTIQVAISKLENTSYRDSVIVKDNVEYTLYVNNHKVASGYKARIKNFPADIQTTIKQMRSLASPLYHKEYGA